MIKSLVTFLEWKSKADHLDHSAIKYKSKPGKLSKIMHKGIGNDRYVNSVHPDLDCYGMKNYFTLDCYAMKYYFTLDCYAMKYYFTNVGDVS